MLLIHFASLLGRLSTVGKFNFVSVTYEDTCTVCKRNGMFELRDKSFYVVVVMLNVFAV